MQVMGIGNPCVDLLARVSQIPISGENARLHATSMQGGGKVATAMCALARLGAQAGLCGSVGQDAHGRFCASELERDGVDCRWLMRDPNGRTPFSIVLSDEKTRERSILFRAGSLETAPIPDDETLRQLKILHLEKATPECVEAARRAKALGVTVSFDADYYVPEMETLTPLTDIFIGSEYYYRALFGDAAEDSAMLRNLQGLRERGPRMVGFTFGARGCVLLQGDSLLKIPAYSVEVRDTTGAGDTFHGAFLYGVLQGWSAENCARFASAAAAIQCTCLGGRAGLPTAAMVERLMQAGEIDPSQLQERQRWYEEQETMA